jgi:RNA polymerase sigma-70 factor, ECF subfamily
VTFEQVYAEQFRFVWRALRSLGTSENDIHDAVQEVFLAVHRKLDEFEGRSQLESWLFGICLRVASNFRRRAHRRHEVATEPGSIEFPDERVDGAAERNLNLRLLESILGEIPESQRAVFVLFEIEGRQGDEIAGLLEIPLGTVYSRLRLARDEFRRALARRQARPAGRDLFASRTP